MTPAARRVIGSFVLVALAGPLVVDWLWTSDEERVAAALDGMERALEERDADALVGWFAVEVEVAAPIPGIPARDPLAEGLRAALSRAAFVALDRDDTRIEFTGEGGATVATSGIAAIEVDGFRVPLRFELRLRLRDAEDGRFRLEAIESVAIRPALG